MKIKGTIFLLALSVLSSTAFGHRLNEYLQATTIRLSRDKVELQLRLTPGVDLAKSLLKDIDANGDGQISGAEQQAYIAGLSRDLSLTLDGQVVTLKPVSFTFPSIADMQKGIGDIVLAYVADIRQSAAAHHLQFKNNHYPAVAVYLVNCLMPDDGNTRVSGQSRNADQSVYELDFTTGAGQASVRPTNDQPFVNATPAATDQPVVKNYFVHGIRHILTGYDHLLFLFALVLGAAGLWDLIKIVTAFTIAHSITLTLAVLGLAHLPENIVEPFIAASIVVVALQNILTPRQATGSTRLAVAFFFGLFHGLGFAGGLLDLMHAMPPNLIVYAILGFSLGVEAGNQLVLLPLYGIVRGIRGAPKHVPPALSNWPPAW